MSRRLIVFNFCSYLISSLALTSFSSHVFSSTMQLYRPVLILSAHLLTLTNQSIPVVLVRLIIENQNKKTLMTLVKHTVSPHIAIEASPPNIWFRFGTCSPTNDIFNVSDVIIAPQPKIFDQGLAFSQNYYRRRVLMEL